MSGTHLARVSGYQASIPNKGHQAWWRHQMETFSVLLTICAGNSPVPDEFPTQRPVTRSFDVFFDLRPNKRLSKQSWGWWFDTPSRPLWRHRNGLLTSPIYHVTVIRKWLIFRMAPFWGQKSFTSYKKNHGLVSVSNKTSYHKIWWSLEAARLVVWIIASLWNFTLLPKGLTNFRAIGQF